jgi:GNAT superfamily N-acetyltransferase
VSPRLTGVTISVDPATRADAEALTDLMAELDAFYGAPHTEPRDQRLAQITRLVFSDQPAAYVLLARDGDQLVGMAAYSFLWPAAGVTQSLFLKELYVSEATRRHGVGRALMERLYAIAAEQECSRVEWMTETDNSAARAFYEAIGAAVHEGKVFYRVEGVVRT